MSLRKLLPGCVLVSTLATAARAYAGTYLDTAALLLDESRRGADFVMSHLGDVQLASLAHRLAEARIKLAREIPVPKDADRAHPHFLLTLEVAERALAAAEDGESKRFVQLVLEARQEEQTFRAVLSQQHFTLPDVQRCEKK